MSSTHLCKMFNLVSKQFVSCSHLSSLPDSGISPLSLGKNSMPYPLAPVVTQMAWLSYRHRNGVSLATPCQRKVLFSHVKKVRLHQVEIP
ncbi:hypothetical protein DPEC_G00307280 [Dallia pectoralis]|uniref:Uncharacterized protein n=1 Tax=Dallia pectoralis TaxID=75939 RepID=A0ACC2FEG3_DALPE|nr:hypothetical protein DPEC_G00307280 [Dallia pectoralis]